MVSKKAKSKTQKKKVQIDPGIRSDIWKLNLSQEQKDLARLTVAEYRHFLKPLVLITYWGWNELSAMTSKDRVNTVEKIFNKTAANPSPNGKKYNCDLSASYNIGARYWYAVLTNSKFSKVWEDPNSSHSQRTPVTLSSLWSLVTCVKNPQLESLI